MHPFGPEHIRTLRGDQSRAVFAERVGVSPLTVYRWELPDDAPEARRPRGRVRAALEQWVREQGAREQGAPPDRRVAAPTPPSPEELAILDAAAAHLQAGRWRRADEDLVTALAQGRLRAPDAVAQATCRLVHVRFLSTGDVRGAFSAILPLLQQVDRGLLSRPVEVAVHCAAAMIFSQPDGHLFDAGKVNAHLARTEQIADGPLPPDLRAMRWLARVSAAFNLSDQALVGRVLDAETIDASSLDPLLQCAVREAMGLRALFSGNPTLARKRFLEAREEARRADAALSEARAIALVGMRYLDDAEEPQRILALAAEGRERIRSARLSVGMHSHLTARLEGEAWLRLARFTESEAAFRESLATTEEVAWSPLASAHGLARLLIRTGRLDELRAFGHELDETSREPQRRICRAMGQLCAAWADVWGGEDPARAVTLLDEVIAEIRAAGGWPFLEKEVWNLSFLTRVLGGTLADAESAERLAAQFVDRHPSATTLAAYRRTAGLLRCRQGRPAEGRQLIEAALATFGLAVDLPEQACTRHILAFVAAQAGDPDAADLAARARAEADAHGIFLGPPLDRSRPHPPSERRVGAPADPHPHAAVPVGRVAVAVERLSLRGVPAALLHRELAEVLADLFPGHLVRLERPDPAGGRVVVTEHVRGEPPGTPSEPAEIEIGDGAGGRLTLSITPALDPDDRTLARTLGQVCSLALELASLRGFASTVASEPVPEEGDPAPSLLAVSPSMRLLKSELGRLASSRATVILTGESGAGKEVVARALHSLSARRDRPLVAFNCAGIPRELFEGQLFGYRKGAFTGATSDHDGVIRAADGGTLFLDEVGELPLDVQPKLLRFLENGEVQPLGERRPTVVDVRVVAATHRDLGWMVREGKFREDLYYRLHVVPVHVPPLRERRDDILPLARAFIRQFTPPAATPPTLGPDAVAALLAHAWAGNVRELRNVIERAMAYAPLPAVLGVGHLRLGG